MSLMGYCSSCGARCMAASGSAAGPKGSRGEQVAAVAISGRRLAYVVEGFDPDLKQDTARLVCRECVYAAMERTT